MFGQLTLKRLWVACGTSALLVMTVCTAMAQASPRIVSIHLEKPAEERDPHLVLMVEQGGFDPSLTWTKMDNGRFRVLLEAEDVELDSGAEADMAHLTREFASVVPQIRLVSMDQVQVDGRPMVRIALETDALFLQPQIRANSGARIAVALMQKAAPAAATSPAPAAATPPVSPEALSYGIFRPDESDVSIYALMASPKTDATLRQAWNDYRNGNLDDAASSVTTYLMNVPQSKVARYLHSLILMARNQRDSATMELRAVLDLDSGYLPALLDLITLRIEAGDFGEAARLVDKGLALWPHQPDLLYNQGLLLEAQGQLEEARKAYTHALAKSPNNLFYRYRLATVELKTNHPKAAEWELQRILLSNPDNIESLKILGFLSQRANHGKTALEYYQRALKPDAMINYAAILKREKQNDAALSLLNAAEILAPKDPDIQYNLGMMYLELQDKKAAERTFNRFLLLAADNRRNDSRIEKVRKTLRSFSATAQR